MPGVSPSEAKRIGFNDPVESGGKTLHVQTEVLTRNGIVIRTTVLDGGIATFAESRPCPPDIADLAALIALVESQHKRHVEQVRSSGPGG